RVLGLTDEDRYQDMQSLLDDESLDFHTLRRGEVVEGRIMGFHRDGVLVDISSKSEGIIPPNEMHSMGAEPMSKLRQGEMVLVYIMQPETPEGQVLLSLDRARGERGWRVLQQRFDEAESFEAEVTGYNKGGLLVNVEGVNAFVPLSQVVGVRPDHPDGEISDGSLAQMAGRKLRVKVIELNRRRNRVILSERAAMQEWRTAQKDRLLSELQEGEIRRGRITSVRPFGVFVDLGGADGLAHLSELSWDRNRSPEEIYHVGDEVDAFVMKVDPDTKKIALSLRRAQPERWEEIADKYHQGQMVIGRVTKLVTFGAFARIEGPVEGLIHVSELVDRRITHPKEVVNEGDVLPLRVVRIERDRHRLGLSLKAARDDAEREGWEFDADGAVIGVPEQVRQTLDARLGPAPDSEPQTGGDVNGPAVDADGAVDEASPDMPNET
ncbi:MAG: 30S ribosomal protein S1, partial [Dehalococcoidia bacterium]